MMIGLSPDKVARIILRAREIGSRVEPWATPDRRHPDEGDPDAMLEGLRNDPDRAALAGYLAELSRGEQQRLVALMWVGRGTFEPSEWDDAVQTAAQEHTGTAGTVRYLLGMPLLADYLEEGLEKMGYSAAAAEDDLL